ncbi:uncharacterized protein LOC129634548 isoform X11 [Bubalus kerabau]|uniref:uncharacterized protein LOC129634548 isoform X11 n=1 Tax=Bubalus carabanensis TaxID=3119969 RepID=UPI00244EFB5A|nr:uncharacterized protein LOC129634548 isoform X11 [Bubalus carabanensis]
MTFPEDSCKHWTLGCTLRSSWISPGPDHYVAREIAQLSCFLSTTAGQERQSLPEPSRPSLLSRDQTWPSSPSPAPGVCFVNTSVEQERTKPARTKGHKELDKIEATWHTDAHPQERSCGEHCRNKLQTQPTFKKPMAKGEMPIKMTTRNQIQPVRMAILTSLQQYMWERAG